MIQAVIGIGSNSTRLLVAEITAAKEIIPLSQQREGTRLFAGLIDGKLDSQSILRVLNAVVKMALAAQAAGASTVHVLATSAAREAANSDELAALIEDATGAKMEILTGEQEARLSLLGAAGRARGGMIDLGGGSTEIAVGGGGYPLKLGSAPVGAVRLLGEVPILGGDGFDRALGIARERAAAVWEQMGTQPLQLAFYGVGGTACCLAALDMSLAVYDRDAVHGHTLRRESVDNWARRLAKMSESERAALPGMLPQRADIIAHGAIALLGVMEALSLERLIVSNRTNLHGYLIDQMDTTATSDAVDEVRSFYNGSVEAEWGRLDRHSFEFAIHQHYIDRYVQPGSRVLDAGGGPGRYSLYMAGRGAQVTLLDLSEGNIAFAREQAKEMGLQLEAVCADARTLDQHTQGLYDVVLLMGPLYHLLEESDRVAAVRAACGKLKPGGILMAAFISTIAGLVYAGREMPESILWEGEDAFYAKIIAREDFAGPAFTQAFFIDPSHVLPFMDQFGLRKLHLVGSEGVTAPFHTRLMEQPEPVQNQWLAMSLALCERDDLLCFSEHLLYIGRKEEKA